MSAAHPSTALMTAGRPALVDGHGRTIDYVRISVTDRCNLRCTYCMPLDMQFAPGRDLLTLAELQSLARHLVARGVRRIRITGGEPLARRGVMELFAAIGGLRGSGLDEITLTTNGTALAAAAAPLAAAGVRRVNVSLDTLDPAIFARIARRDMFGRVIAGIEAARRAGLAVKINMVAMKGVNDTEFSAMVEFCGRLGCDLSLIETMPMGTIDFGREDNFLPLCAARESIERHYTLSPSRHRTGGPSRYFDIAQTGQRIGFITPLSENFCGSCNRIRISAQGMAYGCLGHDQGLDLRGIMREDGARDGARDGAEHGNMAKLDQALDRLLAGKPLRHEFDIRDAAPSVARTMNVTGG